MSLLSLLTCAQVANVHSTIVEAVSGMACSLQSLTIGTETEEQKLPTPQSKPSA